ncbi:MAG: 5-deoxy-glucuronate isomerase, partial [Parvibaculaceae bacterium]
MPKLLVKPKTGDGRVLHVTPATAGWTYVGFDLWKLAKGQTAKAELKDRETCLVFVAGRGRVSVDGKDLGVIGERLSPFDGKPWSVYVPAGRAWSVAAETPLELGVCTAPGSGKVPMRVIRPDDLGQETRGKGTNTRYVTNILPETDPAESLLVVEVITPGGH